MINLHLVRTRSPWRLWPFHCLLRDKVNDGIVRGRRWANRSTLMAISEDKAHLIWGRRPSDVLRCCWRADRCSGGDSETLRGDSPGPQQRWKRAQRVKKKTRDEGCILYRRHLTPAAHPLLWRGLLRFIGLWLQGHRRLFYIGVDQPCREREAVSLTAESERSNITDCGCHSFIHLI